MSHKYIWYGGKPVRNLEKRGKGEGGGEGILTNIVLNLL
jgi:hypothetical protein